MPRPWGPPREPTCFLMAAGPLSPGRRWGDGGLTEACCLGCNPGSFTLRPGGLLGALTTLCSPCRDLNHNDLQEFPVAIRTLGRLQEL